MGELVVSRGDTPEILEPAEAPLNGVAVFASLLVVADFLFAIWTSSISAGHLSARVRVGSPANAGQFLSIAHR